MSQPSNIISLAAEPAAPFMEQLATCFAEMSQAYAAVAERYGFRCNGCEDNCCQTRFYHHTLLEYHYLSKGLRRLDNRIRKMIIEKAIRAIEKMEDADRRNESVRIMCPLNHKGRCLTYVYRPMICRLHGIPHELRRPDGGRVHNPGCDEFFNQCRQCGKTEYIPFDRTPYYRKMAFLEKELRRKTGHTAKLKLTIAQMVVQLTDSTHEID
ncbi:MAG: hypothetical protein CR984_03885 [Proteobacteria bacterium]|nr:MAG: hypothetical protein CR984_03885 [Pseudomonadota bacterium]PIE66802.1 MAG: hypothetical protein CSA23_07205 [Deltaproteobacteria bacterium]